MKKLLSILSLAVLWLPSPSWAQLFPPNEADVSMGAWHTIVRDVDTTRKWWEIWGAKPLKIDGVDVMKFHGVLVFMVPGEPKAPTMGTLIDHIAFSSPKGFDLMKTLVNACVKTDKVNLETMRSPNWKPGSDQRTWNYSYSPDGLRVEIETNEDAIAANDLNAPVQGDMMHFYFTNVSDLRAAYNWYKKYFGARVIPSANITQVIPGTRLNYALSHEGPRPLNRGGALDYIGFEVRNLDAFCKKLEADGVKLDQPYSKTRHQSYASAQLTDPWGTVIELTECLNRF
jgi:catechol 2,3-dioxygenase-like lactoylglutathione lyase family enzyme